MSSVSISPQGRAFTRLRVLDAVPLVASVAVGLALMTAALLKAADPRDTLAVLTFVFGESPARPLLYALIAVEVGLGAALIAMLRPRVTLTFAAALFTVFLGWIGYLELVSAPITCGCGLPSDHWLLGDSRGAAAIRAGTLLIVTAVAVVV